MQKAAPKKGEKQLKQEKVEDGETEINEEHYFL